MTPRTHRHVAATALVVTASLLTACSGTANDPASGDAAYELVADTPDPSGEIDTFSWALYAEPGSLDYAYAFDYPPNTVLANVCESLLRWNPDLTTSPALAETVEHPDPKTWVYGIRPGVTFHDGSALDADDVVASLSRHLDPAVGSYWASAYRNVESIEKTGPLEVTVSMASPDSLFNQYMAASPGTIESADTLAAAGRDYGNTEAGVNCTGPFSLEDWQSGDSITLARYDDYWDDSLRAKSEEVRFVFLPDPNTRVNAWASGQVDGGWQVPPNAYAQLRGSGAGSLYFGVNTTVASEIVSNTSGVLGDVRVRQALLMAADREGMVEAAEQGVAEVSDSLIAPSLWGDEHEAAGFTYDHDVEAARALAEEAGVDGEKVVIATTAALPSADITSAAIAQAATDIGLTPEIRQMSPEKYTALFSDPAAREGIDLFATIWYLSVTDPMDYFSVMRTGEFSNYGGWSDPEFDDLVNETLATELDDPARAGLLDQLDEITTREVPWLPMYSMPTSVWMGERITGVEPSIAFFYYPWAASIGAR